MTTFSPHRVGQVLTRKSMALLRESFSLMRPSWGTRRSETSRRAMTLMRAAIFPASAIGGLLVSWSTPSMRRRTR